MSRVNRKEIIKNLYLDILNREADEDGLTYYLNSEYSYDEISYVLKQSNEYFQLITTNRIPIIIPTHNRPDYLRQVLNALKECEYLDDFYIYTSEEPNEDVSAVFDSVNFMPIIRHKNIVKLGCLLNVKNAIDRAVGLCDNFLIFEDDIVPAKDALALFKWFLNNHHAKDTIIIYHNINKNEGDYYYNKIEKLSHFIPWGWGTNKKVWLEIREFISKDNPMGWDGQVMEKLFTHPTIKLIRPSVSRVQNIGEVGTYVPNPEWQRENQRCKYWAGDLDLMVTDYELI